VALEQAGVSRTEDHQMLRAPVAPRAQRVVLVRAVAPREAHLRATVETSAWVVLERAAEWEAQAEQVWAA